MEFCADPQSKSGNQALLTVAYCHILHGVLSSTKWFDDLPARKLEFTDAVWKPSTYVLDEVNLQIGDRCKLVKHRQHITIRPYKKNHNIPNGSYCGLAA